MLDKNRRVRDKDKISVLFFLLKFITNKIGIVKRKRKKTDVAMSLID